MMKTAIMQAINMSWPTVVIVCSIVTIMRVVMIFKSERRSFTLHEELFNLLFIVYLLVLFQLVTNQDIATTGGTNFKPFQEILRYKIGSVGFYKQVIGNILLFVPLGYFLTKYCKLRTLGGITITAMLSSLCIETTQHFIGRSFDVDDVILNVVGGIVGFLVYVGLNAIKNHLPKFMRKNWFYNLISIILIVLAVLYLIKIY